jgi:hypothetical protein
LFKGHWKRAEEDDGTRKVMDYASQQMIIHDELPSHLEDYAKLEMEYSYTKFCIQTSLQVNGESYPSRYLFDTGFQRSIILDSNDCPPIYSCSGGNA